MQCIKSWNTTKNNGSDCEHSTFDRLGIFALPCQTKWYNKENFHLIQEMKKLGWLLKWILGKYIAIATLEWNF